MEETSSGYPLKAPVLIEVICRPSLPHGSATYPGWGEGRRVAQPTRGAAVSANTELVQSAYDAFSRGDIPAVIGALEDRVEWDVSAALPQGGSWRGRDGVGEFFQNLGGIWGDLHLEVEQLLENEDSVAAVGRAAGRLRDGDHAAGYSFVHLFTVKDGAITRFREWGDADESLRERS